MSPRIDLSKLTSEQQQAGYSAFCATMRAKAALSQARKVGDSERVQAALLAYNKAATEYLAVTDSARE